MRFTCEFCDERIQTSEPENLALFHHLEDRPACDEQYAYMLSNLRASWTVNMSGG
ncbi:MAG TPA: hypothetical protein VM889_09630 [Candidatus Thermoplasmatota archaeon]|nr:hypothetical protein [Candidatus Thermoplasmatota archaeon]